MNLRIVISLILVIGVGGLVGYRIDAASPASYAQTDDSVASGVWSMLNLPDTGQTQGFTSTFGEDADYTIHAPSFTDNGDGTVTDRATGLVWQQTEVTAPMTWEAALQYAEGLALAGHTD